MRRYDMVYSTNKAVSLSGSLFKVFYDDCNCTMQTLIKALSYESIVGVLFVGVMFCMGIM